MRKLVLLIIVMIALCSLSYAAVFKYHFPKPPKSWGQPVSFNNLSPGFFQVMFQDKVGVVRIATYGIAGGTMDTLKNPELLMVFSFDQEKIGSINNY